MSDDMKKSCCGSDTQTKAVEHEPAEKESSCCGSAKQEQQVESCCSTEKAKPASAGCCASEQPAAVNEKGSSCCGSTASGASGSGEESCCSPGAEKKRDWIMWTCLPAVVIGYVGFLVFGHDMGADAAASVLPDWLGTMFHTSFEMVNAMWWGILSAAFFVGILGRIPREVVMSVLGKGGTKRGVFRATMAGLLLDLCNHGILMVGMKLYERGASIGQVMAFLIDSPWNSLTLTLILVGLIGLQWTLLFIVASMLIAWISGWIFDGLVAKNVLPANPHQTDFEEIEFWPTLKASWGQHDWTPKALILMFWQGLKESKMVLRWVVFGVVLVALIRAFVPPESFGVWFGASLTGLLLTLLATTLIEVCSEGSSPIAADLFNRAGAPGNAFTFLMAGAATDYTEIMALKETTRSWKIALYLPLVTVPQVLLIGWLMNVAGV
ncbi:MAG: permease [Thalassolituus sp.]